ncbi:MAG: DUF928 domain-containing protein [Cyanobacteriota bacterium]|nr:DUF928 domain-containing protein [Cyanobacteriota bacterium]
MTPFNYYSIAQTFCAVSIAGVMALATGISHAANARIQFSPPNDPTPQNTTGGGVRGQVRFQTPGDAAPGDTTGGGVRGDIGFQAPGDAAPGDTTGGGVRGDIGFQAPGDASPDDSTGGGVRGDVGFQAPGDASPDDSTGGGVRGDELVEVIPLLPSTQYGRTIAARPTIMVYVPETVEGQKAFFSLQDEQRNHHYQMTLELSGEGGVLLITLPEDAPELEVGKNYVWFFAPIQSDGILRPDNYDVVGWVKRVESPVAIDRTVDPIETAIELAESGIWYDTLSLVAQAKQNQPQNATYASEWHDLLEQVGLQSVASRSIRNL